MDSTFLVLNLAGFGFNCKLVVSVEDLGFFLETLDFGVFYS